MGRLCTNCVKDQPLKNSIAALEVANAGCAVCGTRGTALVECTNPEFKARFRALIRYHYSEPEYNPHLGGNGLEDLLFKRNSITNYAGDWNENAYSEALVDILEVGYEEGDTGVSLFAGYADGQQNSRLIALKGDTDDRIGALKLASITKNHFLLEERARKLIAPLVATVERTIARDTVLYRSRVGYVRRGFPITGWLEERHYRPYEGSELGAPPPPVAEPGRMNRSGVSYLYLATTPDTAISEIRPHPGHHCSVGAFRANDDLRVCDLSTLNVTDFASDAKLRDFLLLKSIDDAFSIPVVPENRSEYHFPQLLADVFRHLEFDGIGFRSSVGPGTNFTFFDPAAFRFEENSATVTKIESLKYATTPMHTMSNDAEDYWKRPDGSFL